MAVVTVKVFGGSGNTGRGSSDYGSGILWCMLVTAVLVAVVMVEVFGDPGNNGPDDSG